MKINPLNGFKRASDPKDATRHQDSMEKLREKIEAAAQKKKEQKSGESTSIENELFGNKEI